MTGRAPIPPFVHRTISGRFLDNLRVRADLTQQQVAEHLGCAQSKIVNIESGLSALQPHDRDKLLDLYGAEGSTRQEAERLAKLGKQRASRYELRTRFEGEMRNVVDMEASANTIWVRNAMLIPGLLQTEPYMRYVFRAYRPSLTSEQIDRSVEARLARQQVLHNLDQRFWFNIDEAALRRMGKMDGSSSLMREQIKRLIEAIDLPNVEVQIVDFDSGYYMGQDINYMVFGYETDPPVHLVYVEQYDGGDTLQDSKNVHRFLTLWDHQRAAGLGPEQTRSFLTKVAASL